jgi:HEAT repeat protein
VIRYCSQCWKEVPAGAENCPPCGRNLSEPQGDFVDRLIAALRHPEPTRAGLAIDVLAHKLHEPRVVQPMIDLLGATQDISILKQAARGLGALGDARAVAPLARLLGNPDAP